jgi:hypothetical protein
MTNNPTERAARATTAAKISTASADRHSKEESPGVAQPATVGTGDKKLNAASDEGGLGPDPDAKETAHLGSGTAR